MGQSLTVLRLQERLKRLESEHKKLVLEIAKAELESLVGKYADAAGRPPLHEWNADRTKIRWEQPDGSWGEWSEDLQGPPGATQIMGRAAGGLSDAPSDGTEYVRKNGAWSAATGGGGGSSDWDTLEW